MEERAERRGQQLAAPYGKMVGAHAECTDLEPFQIKMHLRHTLMRFVAKAAPDLVRRPAKFT
jgi:hypothetical protein